MAKPRATRSAASSAQTELKGVDVFVYWPSRNTDELAAAVGKAAGDGLALHMIDNRGVKVWPDGIAGTFCTDSYRCRFMAEGVDAMGKLWRCWGASRARAWRSPSTENPCATSTARPGSRWPRGSQSIELSMQPLVAVIMGSKSDWDVMRQADETAHKVRRAA